jgi:iron complex outermembrane receptor protein
MTADRVLVHAARVRRIVAGSLAVALSAGGASVASAQGSAAQTPAGRIEVPPVTVTAQKEPGPAERLPVSVTAVTSDVLQLAGISQISDVARFAPNTYFSELSARKISNALFRGIGSSPANPGITTFIDGVPQLNTNTSNVELVDVDQIEFVRGPQSPLFGRNTLGGVVNVASRRPSLSAWTGQISVPLASEADRGFRAQVSGPIAANRLAVAGAFGASRRDGFTTNTVTGHTLDDRSAVFGKAQVLWAPTGEWRARVIVSAERDRDGDYALVDLGALRGDDPYSVARDFEGDTERDIFATTVLARREGRRITFSSTTGIVRWDARDRTDLDYTPLPLVRRDNAEEAAQFSQEVRIAAAAPTRLSDRVSLGWQAGVFLFTQSYEQLAVNRLAPFALDPQIPFPIEQTSPESVLDDVGVGVFGHGTATIGDAIDVSLGVRVDHESREASLQTYLTPALAPPTVVEAERGFTSASPQASVVYRWAPDRMVYGSVARGFKAGGFNPAAPAGSEVYDEEAAWHVEGGVKTFWANRRVSASAAVFFIDWNDLQLNQPDPFVPARFYIANVGAAASRGVELELQARVHEHARMFGSFGYTHARFSPGSLSNDLPVDGNRLPNTPEFTAMIGGELARPIGGNASVFGRVEVTALGAFEYDDLNTARQDAFALADIRVGLRARRLVLEGWVRNVFDTRYVPIALQFDPRVAPSGFIGEPGRPRRFGVSLGVEF